MIELKNLERSYPIASGRSWVLRNVNLAIKEGEFLSITGPSGSGKSSLLNVLGMLDGEWQGEFNFEGQAVHKMSLKQRQTLQRDTVGFIFQQYHLLSDLTVAENLELPLTYRDLPTRERSARVADALDRFQIVGKKDLLPTQLSGGQQQLVAVARALITKPRVILADEPTGALHSDQARMIMQTLKQLHGAGATIVQVTHNPEYAAMGSRRVELFDGWLKELPA